MPPVPNEAAVREYFHPRIQLVRTLRIGGQGAVYEAIRTATLSGIPTSDAVAIKLYFDSTQDDRVDREIAALSAVRHLTLANLIEHGVAELQTDKYRYIVWEFIGGEALDSRLAHLSLPPTTVARIGRDIATALCAIWARRIVHRDVNPKNIMLRTGEEGAVLIDLGVAKYLNQTPLTAPGLTWGTRGYLSPEQMLGTDLTCQSDVFSLGITLQQALVGRHPTGYDQNLLLRGGRPTAELAGTAPAILARTLDSMLNARPAHRPTPTSLVGLFSETLEMLD